jgi:phosphoglycerol transferase MdoB-like AlkP superfamily enzyme
MAAYISVIPLLLSMLAQSKASKVVNRMMIGYTYVVLTLVTILSLIDAQLYAFWGQKIDAYASSFAKFPKDMLSFSGVASVGKLVFFLFLSFFAITIPFDSMVMKFDQLVNRPKKASICLYFVLSGAVLFLFIRGNVGMSPINQSFVYYSQVPFCNHAAVNTSWNFMASVLDNSEVEKKNTYQFIPQAQAQQLVAELFSATKTSNLIKLTHQANPNILFVILEGWTADVVGFTGGDSTVTPRLNSWARQGLIYNNFYANGNRTDKGLAAILSAQPALSRSSIINKLQKYYIISTFDRLV